MAKRANPYTEDYVQQSKVHVGLKQFNNNKERLDTVYEKTLEKLFKGAKRSQQDSIKSDVVGIVKEDGLKQLFIGNNGLLTHSGKMLKEKPIQNTCKCGNTMVERCAYCEKGLCVSCEYSCILCYQYFCTECSVYGCEGSICFSCYR
ncbi:unnamed protein product [Leptosia nina]|uniref:Apoptosis regulatory protein Siva n=1 Tax=Leptosia nina TaxID=320188 RepID=A0AAV1JHB8_9NEOP